MTSFVFQTHFGEFYTEKKSDGKYHAVCHKATDTTEIVRDSLPEIEKAVQEVRE